MNFSAQEEYGLRCILQLAKGHGSEAVTARQISEQEFISLDYVFSLPIFQDKFQVSNNPAIADV